jgi:Flp pilus assembly protein TadG
VNRDRGSVTIWVLGLVLLVLALGGLSIDLWRGVVARKAVVAVADAAAVAGASGIDETAWRNGELALDGSRAKALAERVILSEPNAMLLRWRIDATSAEITVTVEREVDLTLLRLTDPAGGSLVVRASATARPQVSR